MLLVMEPDRNPKRGRILLVAEMFFVLGGICIFAWFIHREGILFFAGLAGLVLAATVLSRAVLLSGSPGDVLGLARFDSKVLACSLAGLLVGVIVAVSYRIWQKLAVLPGALTIIALVSPLIGMTEEFIFRGYLQGRARHYGPVVAVVIAAAGHTLYKYLVLRSLGGGIIIDFPRLVLFTFLFGLVVGTFRQVSKSIVPALAAHAVFDILVYGDFNEMPIWVWG